MNSLTALDRYALTPLQSGMLFNALRSACPGVDLQQIVFSSPDPLNLEAMRAAWETILARHEVLRTRFVWTEKGAPSQVVLDEVQLPLEVIDWSGTSESERDQRLTELLSTDREQRGLSLDTAPMTRVTILDRGSEGFQCLWTFHHATIDGRSFTIVMKEVLLLYNGLLTGEPVDLPKLRPFGDYVRWQQGLARAPVEAYWREYLRGFTALTPIVSAEAPEASRRGAWRWEERRLSGELTARLRATAETLEVTLNTFVQGAWALLLHAHTREQQVLFGVTRACRHGLDGLRDMVGLFINTVPLRVAIDPDMSIAAFLKDLRRQQVEVRPFEVASPSELQQWSEFSAGSSLFESIIVFENEHLDTSLRSLGGQAARGRTSYRGQTGYPLTLYAYGDPIGMKLQLEFDSERVGEESVGRMLAHMESIFEGLLQDPTQPIGAVNLLTSAERTQLLSTWNDTARDYPRDTCVHQLFEAQVDATPDAKAVAFGDACLTYAELDGRANALAHRLIEMGVVRGTLVGLSTVRCLDMLVGLLGILKAGGAYVPLDPTYPDDRLSFMAEDAGLSFIVTQAALQDSWPDSTTVFVDQFGEGNVNRPDAAVNPEDLAYVIYTSGSTGRPKGVCAPHRGIVNRLAWMWTAYPYDPLKNEINAIKTSMSFVDHVWEFLGSLLRGVPSIIAADEVARSPIDLMELLAGNKVTRLVVVPSLLRELVALSPKFGEWLPSVISSSGEELDAELAVATLAAFPSAVLLNLYGSSEVSGDVSVYEVPEDFGAFHEGRVPIGRPIANTQLYVLNAAGHPTPIGVCGELYAGGEGVAQGYLNRPELTAQKFIDNPFGDGRLFRTGDLARWRADGQIQFLGRMDTQVKVRGFRIELGEIESVLCEHPSVLQAVVVLQEARLVAYVAPRGDSELSPSSLRAHLKGRLPEYMVPSVYMTLDAVPLTPSGKVDRNALPAPSMSEPSLASGDYVAPRTDLEARLGAIWGDLLQLNQVGVHESFFDLGGHSLLAITLSQRIQEELGTQVDLGQLFTTPTIAELAETMASETLTTGRALVPLQRSGEGAPLVCLCGINLYQGLALSLTEQPVFAIYLPEEQAMLAEAAQDESAVLSVSKLAGLYFEAIQEQFGAGPYRLMGFCFGGLLAYEVAQLATAAGGKVELLILLDTPLWNRIPRSARKWLSHHTQLVRQEGISHVWRRAAARLGLKKPGAAREAPADQQNAATARLGALARRVRTYEPSGSFSGSAVLVRAADPTLFVSHAESPLLGWEDFLKGEVGLEYVSGMHAKIMDSPNVEQMAAKLGAYLAPTGSTGAPRGCRSGR